MGINSYVLTIEKKGQRLPLSWENGYIVHTIKGINSHVVDISTAQGYQQIGNTVTGTSVKGKTMTVTGRIRKGNVFAKKRLISMLSPMSTVRLWYDDKYWIDCVVKYSPEIPLQELSVFSFQLFAPRPFWHGETSNIMEVGKMIPMFSFPVNYSTPHVFGVSDNSTEINAINVGDVETDFSLEIRSQSGVLVNPRIINVETGAHISFTGELGIGAVLRVHRVEGILYAELEDDGQISNAMDMIDDDSDLFVLNPGDNILRLFADSGANTASVFVEWYDSYIGVVYGM